MFKPKLLDTFPQTYFWAIESLPSQLFLIYEEKIAPVRTKLQPCGTLSLLGTILAGPYKPLLNLTSPKLTSNYFFILKKYFWSGFDLRDISYFDWNN